MAAPHSPNTQAILLLTAPLLATPGQEQKFKPLTPAEYKKLVQLLMQLQLQRQPADLLEASAEELRRACAGIVGEERLGYLLGRGFLLSQAVERWKSRAIWVISRADPSYPRRYLERLREDAPALLWGCGDIRLFLSGGLAVVGSRRVPQSLLEYTMDVGELAARSGKTVVSGGADGVDSAAVHGAMRALGNAVVVLPHGLERAALSRENRRPLLEGRLILVSPYDPGASFAGWRAMQRNKLVYALADAALVVNSDAGKGGTWAGAEEQLEKYKHVPVYVRSTGMPSAGLDALRKKGALDWPNPGNSEELEAALGARLPRPPMQAGLFVGVSEERLSPGAPAFVGVPAAPADRAEAGVVQSSEKSDDEGGKDDSPAAGPARRESAEVNGEDPAELLFAAVRHSMRRLLKTPMKDTEIAEKLGLTNAQARAWLKRLVEDGELEKRGKPPGYVVSSGGLFNRH